MINKEDKIFNSEQRPKAILASVYIKGSDVGEYETSLEELKRLLDTAGGEFFAFFTQEKDSYDVRYAIGSGKVEELKEICQNNDIDLVVFDTELSPSQIKNIEEKLESVRVIDRSMLILDIFALHATTSEGKLQVELAQLKYTLPRLSGKGTELSRLGGGIGTRGPGETKLEVDRRRVRERTAALEEKARELEKKRSVMRSQRDRSGLFKIAIAGYTNAGKSTILNYLTDADILAEDKLFATLDPTTRKYELPSGCNILITDTVGFIRNLPHHLIKAFKSTLDEAVFADAIMLVCDSSSSECASQLGVAKELLEQLGADNKPIIYVYNKCDVAEADFTPPANAHKNENDIEVFVSAKTGEGMESLISALETVSSGGKRKEVFVIPSDKGAALSRLYKNSEVISCEYKDGNTEVVAIIDSKEKGIVEKMING